MTEPLIPVFVVKFIGITEETAAKIIDEMASSRQSDHFDIEATDQGLTLRSFKHVRPGSFG